MRRARASRTCCTRHYRQQGDTADFYVANNGKDPDNRYAIRGNGEWNFKPSLTAGDCEKQIHSALNILTGPAGLQPAQAGEASRHDGPPKFAPYRHHNNEAADHPLVHA